MKKRSRRFRCLRPRAALGMPLKSHDRLFARTQKSFRERAREKPILDQQVPLLWTIARVYEGDEQGWQRAANVTKDIAAQLADRTSTDRRVRKYLAIVMVVSFLACCVWLAVGQYFIIAPLFRASGWQANVIGHLLQLVGVAIVFFVIWLFAIVERSMRHVPMIRQFADYASYAVPFIAVIPSISVYSHLRKWPQSYAVQGLFDGLFAGGFILMPLIVAVATGSILQFLRRERSIWDNPKTAFLEEALACLDNTIPPSTSMEAIRRLVDYVFEQNDQWVHAKPALAEKVRALIVPGANAAEERWWLLRKQIRNQRSPNPVFSALANFMWRFHPSQSAAKDEWGQPNRMSVLASHIRNCARCVQVFGQRQQTGEAVQDNWQQRVCEERAAFLRALQRGPLLPRPDTRDYLIRQFKALFELVLQDDWGNMPLIELPDVPRLSWRQKVFRTVRTIFVAALPLATLYALSDQLRSVHATISGPLWGGAIIWLAVSLLTLLDERFSEKLSGVKEIFGVLKSGKEKE